MSVFVQSKEGSINVQNVESWTKVNYWGKNSGFGVYAWFKAEGAFGKPYSKLVGSFPTAQAADEAITKILEGILEAEKSGGGIVAV